MLFRSHDRRGDALAEDPPERFVESFELGGDITELAGADLTDDDDIRAVDTVPFRLWLRGSAQPRKRREQDGCPGPNPTVTPLSATPHIDVMKI